MNYQFSKTVGKRKLHGGLFCGLFALLAMVVATLGMDAGFESASAVGVMSTAGLPFLMIQPPCMDSGTDGGGGMSQKAFQDKTLKLMEDTQGKVNGLGEEQKKYADSNDEALKQLQESQTDSEEGRKALEKQIGKLYLAQKNQHRKHYGDAVDAICEDPEKKTLFNAVVRKAMGKDVPLSDDHQKALTSASTPGSTYVNDELMTDIYDTLSTYGVWNSFDVRTVNKKNNKFLVKTARPIAKIFGEGVTITEDSSKAGTSVTQEAKGIKVLLSVPNELLDDSEVDLSRDILVDFIEAVAFRMDFMCLTADGTSDDLNGGMTGIFEGGTDAVATVGRTTMEDLKLEDVTATLLAADESVMGRAACWWIHPHMLVRFLHIKDANDRSIFLPSTSAPSPGAIGSILGFPVKLSAAAPSANTAGSPVAVFGDPKGMVAGLRKGFEFKSSMEAAFSDDETVFRGIARFGNKIRSASAFAVLKLAAT